MRGRSAGAESAWGPQCRHRGQSSSSQPGRGVGGGLGWGGRQMPGLWCWERCRGGQRCWERGELWFVIVGKGDGGVGRGALRVGPPVRRLRSIAGRGGAGRHRADVRRRRRRRRRRGAGRRARGSGSCGRRARSAAICRRRALTAPCPFSPAAMRQAPAARKVQPRPFPHAGLAAAGMDGWRDRGMDRWRDGWMEGWMEGGVGAGPHRSAAPHGAHGGRPGCAVPGCAVPGCGVGTAALPGAVLPGAARCYPVLPGAARCCSVLPGAARCCSVLCCCPACLFLARPGCQRWR